MTASRTKFSRSVPFRLPGIRKQMDFVLFPLRASLGPLPQTSSAKLFVNGALDQNRSAINHQRLTRGECFPHKEQIGLRYVMRFADSAHRQTVAHALIQVFSFF